MRERLAVRADLDLGPLGARAQLRFVGHDRAVLGQRLHLGDPASPGQLPQAVPHGSGQRIEGHLFLDLQHGAVSGDTDVLGVAVEPQRDFILDLTVVRLARIAADGRALALLVDGLLDRGRKVGALQLFLVLLCCWLLCCCLGRDRARQKQGSNRPFRESHRVLVEGVRTEFYPTVPYSRLTGKRLENKRDVALARRIRRSVPSCPPLRSRMNKASIPALALLVGAALAWPRVSPAQSFKVAKYSIGGDGGTDYLLAEPGTGRVFVSRSTHVMVIDGNTGK